MRTISTAALAQRYASGVSKRAGPLDRGLWPAKAVADWPASAVSTLSLPRLPQNATFASHQTMNVGAGDGALLASRAGTLCLYGPKVKPVSAVGTGDSFVGGVTAALPRGQDVRNAFMLGMAAGTAAVITPGTELRRREDLADECRVFQRWCSPGSSEPSLEAGSERRNVRKHRE
jgi:hypothetical protein